MVKKHQKSKASRACAAQWTCQVLLLSQTPVELEGADEFVDSQSDCGYTGGVNVEVLSSDSDSSK